MLSAIALLVFATLCFLALWRPHWAGVLALSYIGYEQLLSSFYAAFARNSWFLNVLSGSVVLMAVLFSIVMGRKPVRGYININTVLVGLLYVIAVFGVTYSMMPAAGMYFIKKGLPPAALMLVLFPIAVLSWDTLKKMAFPMMIMGSFLVLMIIISPRTKIYGSRLFIDLSYTGASTSERGNPLAIAEVGGYVMLFAALIEPDRRSTVLGLVRLGAFTLGAAIAFLVGSRGQLVFALFFSALFYPLAHQVKDVKQFFFRAGSGGIALGVIAIVGKVLASSSASSARFTASDISTGLQGRMYFATELLGEYAVNPANYLQGIGTGSFNAVVKHGGEGFLYPHNVVVEVLAHHGLIGLAVLTGIFAITGVHMLKAYRMARKGLLDRSAVAIMLALICYTTMLSMKQGSFILIPLPFFTYLLLSKLVTRQSVSEAYNWSSEEEYDLLEQEYGDPEYT
ncbi:MAG: O-antigen ligase family protein [Phycisphaerales bacterium]